MDTSVYRLLRTSLFFFLIILFWLSIQLDSEKYNYYFIAFFWVAINFLPHIILLIRNISKVLFQDYKILHLTSVFYYFSLLFSILLKGFAMRTTPPSEFLLNSLFWTIPLQSIFCYMITYSINNNNNTILIENKIKERMLDLISKNDLDECFKIAKNYFQNNEDSIHTLVIREGEWNNLKMQYNTGIISNEEYRLTVNKIAKSILSLRT